MTMDLSDAALRERADAIEAELRRLEIDPTVTKEELRLFLQSPMGCGHAVGNLLTCPDPPFGCCVCAHRDAVHAEQREADARIADRVAAEYKAAAASWRSANLPGWEDQAPDYERRRAVAEGIATAIRSQR